MNETNPLSKARPDFARLKNLTRNPSDIKATFEEMGKVLQKCHLKAKLRFQVTDGDQVSSYDIALENGSYRVEEKARPEPEFEVLTTSETWWEIASGKLAPLEAVAKGLMRFRGNTQIGVRVLTHLAGTEGRTQMC